MGGRPDKQSRKDLLHQLRAKQRAEARAKLPLADPEMKRLFDALAEKLSVEPCNHSLCGVEEWCRRESASFDAVATWCHDNGGHCDCEVLVNCKDQWLEAIHDVNWS